MTIMQSRPKTSAIEARLFFAAFILFAVIVVGSVKSAYDDFLDESYVMPYSTGEDGE